MRNLKKVNQVWFWQNMLTPHMSELAVEYAKLGNDVIFVCNQILSKDRIDLGWQTLKLTKVKFKLAKNKKDIIKIARQVPNKSIHLIQGIRGNGIIKYAQKIFRKRNLNQWFMMETINNNGFKGVLRNILYCIIFFYWRKSIKGVLAIGRETSAWVVKKGVSQKYVFPFAYFIKQTNSKFLQNIRKNIFRFIFVGRLIKRKRIDMLIKALSTFKESNFELWIVGVGEQKTYLKKLADELISNKVTWFDSQPMNLIPKLIKQADCLVLPSAHDGWGVVVSESLMVGTPVICSDSCGSSIVVKASNHGCVFSKNNQSAFIEALNRQLNGGLWSTSKRKKLAQWANCLSAKKGALYLEKILSCNESNYKLIAPPWSKN
jgi:glycosyltransferase involved in cell wall biosynthesis